MSDTDNDLAGLRDGVLIMAGLAILLTALKMSANIVVPFLLALFLTIIAIAPVSWLQRKGAPKYLAICAVIVLLVLVFFLVSLLLGSTLTEFRVALPAYEARLNSLTADVFAWLDGRGLSVADSELADTLDPGQVMVLANGFVSGIGDALSNIFLIVFLVIFMLAESVEFPRKLASLNSSGDESALESVSAILDSIKEYAAAKAVISLVTGIVIWAALALVGLDFAPLWGFLAFLLNFIPNIGSILAAIPAVFISILQFDPVMMLVVIGIYVAANVVIGNFLEPMIMGQKVGLSILAVFVSLLFWGWMFGAVGMLLSVPLTMVVKNITQLHPSTHWVGVLLSRAPKVT